MKSNIKLIASIIKSQHGKAVTVTFIKRSTGKKRTMNCRLGVTKHLKGGEQRYNPADYKLIRVYDLKAQGYRSIPLDSVREVKAGGEVFKFKVKP